MQPQSSNWLVDMSPPNSKQFCGPCSLSSTIFSDLSSKSTTQYNNDYYTKRHSEPLVIVQDREGRRNRSVCFDNLGRCNECGTKHEAWESCDQSTFATSYSYRQLNPIKVRLFLANRCWLSIIFQRGICRPIDGVAATLAPQLHPRYPTTTKLGFSNVTFPTILCLSF